MVVIAPYTCRAHNVSILVIQDSILTKLPEFVHHAHLIVLYALDLQPVYLVHPDQPLVKVYALFLHWHALLHKLDIMTFVFLLALLELSIEMDFVSGFVDWIAISGKEDVINSAHLTLELLMLVF